MTGQRKLILSRIIIFGDLLDKLKSFYVDHFDFSVTEEIPGQWIVLNAGPVEIALHKIGSEHEPKGEQAFRAESNTKLVFQIRDDLEGFREQLISKGVLMYEIKSFKGINALFCDGEDPEGNVFQIEQSLSLNYKK